MRATTITAIICKNIEHWFYKIIGLDKKIIPYKALLQLTNDCNSRCKSCHIWTINKENPELKKKELVATEWENFFKNFKHHLLWLSLSGGEVTLYENWNEFFDLARKYCPNLKFITFTTNGLLPEKVLALAMLIRNYGYDQFITISLDSDEKSHDFIRGINGNYQLATTTKKLLKDNGFITYFGVTLSEANHDFIKKSYIDFRHEMKAVSLVHSGGIYATTNPTDDKLILSSLSHIRKLFILSHFSEIIEWIYIRLGEKFLAQKRKKSIIPCDVMSSSVHVMPNGDLHPCMFLRKISNVKDSTFFNELTKPETLALRKKIQQGECPKCWMNCYTPHSIMQHPIKSFVRALWPI